MRTEYTLVKDITSDQSLTITDKTTSRKTYYYKVRSYKKTDAGRIPSPFSGIKSIKSK